MNAYAITLPEPKKIVGANASDKIKPVKKRNKKKKAKKA